MLLSPGQTVSRGLAAARSQLLMRHYYANVPGLGNVALSRHAQRRAEAEGVTDAHVAEVLEKGVTRPDGHALWREHRGLRLVLVNPQPWRGAKLVTTLYRVTRRLSVK